MKRLKEILQILVGVGDAENGSGQDSDRVSPGKRHLAGNGRDSISRDTTVKECWPVPSWSSQDARSTDMSELSPDDLQKNSTDAYQSEP